MAARPVRDMGTLTIIAAPLYYGDTVDFAWSVPKRPRAPIVGVYGYQDGMYHYITELGVDRALEGTTHGEVQIDNENSSAVPGSLDYTRPAQCYGVMWDELSVGQQPRVITQPTPWFTVLPRI